LIVEGSESEGREEKVSCGRRDCEEMSKKDGRLLLEEEEDLRGQRGWRVLGKREKLRGG
jgi:hypothetical protein